MIDPVDYGRERRLDGKGTASGVAREGQLAVGSGEASAGPGRRIQLAESLHAGEPHEKKVGSGGHHRAASRGNGSGR